MTRTAQAPYVANYPELRDWLENHNARCVWQLMRGEPDHHTQAVECWAIGKSLAIVVVHADQHGWEIYTAPDTLRVDETLRDAEIRCGVPKTCVKCGTPIATPELAPREPERCAECGDP